MKANFDDLYKAFEDRFRGSREVVKARLRIYLPLLTQLPKQGDQPNLAIDLGCGRGEWLEILAEAGLDAIGVDLNARMAQEAIDNGLRIELQDALQYMSGQADNSVAVISAFHMVEHVPTDYLIELLYECHRVLVEGGLLVLETPNPENVSVGTYTFHLDPTHKSPLPPKLLEFLVEQTGFPEPAVLRLNGAPMIEAGPIERSIHLMFEVARDYACLAKKRDKQPAGEPKSLTAFVQAASQQMPADIGRVKEWLRVADDEIVSIPELKGTMSALQETVAARDVGIDRLSEQLQRSAAQIDAFQNSIAARDVEIDRLGEQLQRSAAQIDAFQNSTSWRLTTPLRGMKHVTRTIIQGPKDKGRLFMNHALLWVGRRPRIRLSLRRVVRLMPPLERRLLVFAHSRRHAVRLDGGTYWMMEPDPAVLAEWKKILRKHQR